MTPCDGCTGCRVDFCGDGRRCLIEGEQCDDANNVNGDGCDANCQFEQCGNGSLDPGETCDDGNAVDESDPQVPISPTDNCPKICVIGTCGAGSTTAQVVPVDFTAPPGAPALFGITVFLDYPDAKADLVGQRSGGHRVALERQSRRAQLGERPRLRPA
jgi:cysteine-rich repeat protein